MKRIENLLLSISAMKAGTSWLYANLREHADIDCVPVKEIHYFFGKHCDDGILTYNSRLSSLRYNLDVLTSGDSPRKVMKNLEWCKQYLCDPVDDDWFAELFRDPASSTYCAEFSNLNFILPTQGWKHIKDISERQKILLTLRDPISRLWSHVRFQATWVGQFDDLENMSAADFSRFIDAHGLWNFGTYAKMLKLLREQFSEQAYHIIIYEDIKSDPLKVLNEVYEFLSVTKVNPRSATVSEIRNPSKHLSLPAAFKDAAAPMIRAEWAELDSIGFPTPEAWAIA